MVTEGWVERGWAGERAARALAELRSACAPWVLAEGPEQWLWALGCCYSNPLPSCVRRCAAETLSRHPLLSSLESQGLDVSVELTVQIRDCRCECPRSQGKEVMESGFEFRSEGQET